MGLPRSGTAQCTWDAIYASILYSSFSILYSSFSGVMALFLWLRVKSFPTSFSCGKAYWRAPHVRSLRHMLCASTVAFVCFLSLGGNCQRHHRSGRQHQRCIEDSGVVLGMEVCWVARNQTPGLHYSLAAFSYRRPLTPRGAVIRRLQRLDLLSLSLPGSDSTAVLSQGGVEDHLGCYLQYYSRNQ